MIIMSARIKEIIQIIIEEKGYITMKEIAGKMNISERTVYREIPEVTRVLSEYDITLETVSKKGIHIIGKHENVKKLLENLSEKVHIQVIEPRERMGYILLYLLHEDDFMKAESLAIDLETSLPTIRNDLKKIQNLVPEYRLKLIQKKGEGIYLSGTRVSKDHLLVNLLMENVEMSQCLLWLEGDMDKSHPFLEKMDQWGYSDDFCKCYQMFSSIQDNMENQGFYMEDQAYLEFVMLVALMIRRHGEQEEVVESEYLLSKGEKEKQWAVDQVRKIVEQTFDFEFRENELSYLAFLVHIFVTKKSGKKAVGGDYLLRSKVVEFIEQVEEHMGIYLSQDQKLMDGLLTHMDKAIKRTRSGMSISNPVIREIEKDYEQLFEIIKQSVSTVFPDDYFPDDEIGYLVLYFAVSLDNITKKTFRILVVCSSGMGSSKMLASRLEREIPEIYVRKIVSLIGLGKEDLNDYDLILSTIPLYLDSEAYLKVSPLLNQQELALVKEKIRRHKHRTLKRIEEREKNSNRWEAMDGFLALSQLNRFTEYSMSLLADFKVIQVHKDMTQEALYEKISRWTTDIGMNISKEEMAAYYESKNVRECYFVIPATKVSYFECFLSSIEKPALLVCHFGGEEVEDWQSEEKISAMAVLFYPRRMDSLEREFIESITDLIIEDGNMIQKVEQGDEEGIKQCLSFQFLEHIRGIV
ncbi:MAG: BglG family transcription antiterminator [Anaerostipes sp.]|uniref:BglG family transcription antiterminator n=1 Tax=Anaerostipes sp. TaxID=1872530 RepID=UPI0039913C4E